MRRLDNRKIMPLNTWYFLGINSCKQMLYCLKRINDPILEHVGNHFSPIPQEFHGSFITNRNRVIEIYSRAAVMIEDGDFTDVESLRHDCNVLEEQISSDSSAAMASAQNSSINLDTLMLTVHVLQESEQLVALLSQMLRGMNLFGGMHR